jgi:dTDP-4-dehydrorhamnose 3,5-epimerase
LLSLINEKHAHIRLRSSLLGSHRTNPKNTVTHNSCSQGLTFLKMKVEETPLKDCFIIYNTLFKDERGYFFESFNQQRFYKETGINPSFVQDNQSRSTRGVLRGLHFQRGEHAQAKLVRVLRGSVLDVAVDLRPDSETYGRHFSIVLTEASNTQLFVPKGFAHGFLVLTDVAEFFYKCDHFYNKESEGGIIYNDPELNIDWKMDPEELLISPKDLVLPTLSQVGAIKFESSRS